VLVGLLALLIGCAPIIIGVECVGGVTGTVDTTVVVVVVVVVGDVWLGAE
jgi:hypothetical protein